MLKRFRRQFKNIGLKSKTPEPEEFFLDGLPMPIKIKYNQNSKKISLRIDHKKRCCILTVPTHITTKRAVIFAQKHQSWIENQCKTLKEPILFKDKTSISVAGIEYIIEHCSDKLRGRTYSKNNIIYVYGTDEHVNRRVKDYIKKQAKDIISKISHEKAMKINKKVSRITLRDTSSRWGSCSSNGNLSFSWRLIFAPDYVLDYVIAHEVSHLQHMNHSAEFWTLCYQLSDRAEESRNWLKRHGQSLYLYGGS